MKHTALFLLLSSCFGTFLTAETVPAERETVVLLIAQSDVDRALTAHIKRGVQEAEKNNATILILMLNTFGGLVNEALSITTLLGGLENIRTIAYIPVTEGISGVSWSAGALISFSCNEIYMEAGTSIGSATPVTIEGDKANAADEKVTSALRAQIRALAEKNGYNTDIAVAMVDRDIELYETVRNNSPVLVQEHGLKTEEKSNVFLTSDKLLALTAGEMERFGQASIVSNRSELYEILDVDASAVLTIERDILDNILALLSSEAVKGFLYLIGIAGIYFTFTKGTFGTAGIASLLAFSMLFLTNTMLGNLGTVEILLILSGVVLIILEIFVIPGFGIAGISGGLMLLAAFILMQQDFIWPDVPWQWDVLWKNILVILISIAGTLILLFGTMILLPNLGIFKRAPRPNNQNSNRLEPAFKESINTDNLEPGTVGVCLTKLRPVGTAQFGKIQCQVRAHGSYIDAGTRICIVGKDSFDIIVKEVT